MNITQQVAFAQSILDNNGPAAYVRSIDGMVRASMSNKAHNAFVTAAAENGFEVNQLESFKRVDVKSIIKTVKVNPMNAKVNEMLATIDGAVTRDDQVVINDAINAIGAKPMTKAQIAKATRAAAEAAKVQAELTAQVLVEETVVLTVKAQEKLNDTENYNKAIAVVSVKDMTLAANDYTLLVTQAEEKLQTLYAIGMQFCLIKAGFISGVNAKGENKYDDNGFSRCINTTPLKVISKRDRSDCVWLCTNWEAIAEFKKDGVTSNSVTYLRKLMTDAAKAAKAEEAAKAKAAAEAEAKANASAESDALEGEFELVDGEATPKQAQTIESLVSTIQGLVDASEHSMECVLSMLLASSETVKLVTK
jgi:hypothetical protein